MHFVLTGGQVHDATAAIPLLKEISIFGEKTVSMNLNMLMQMVHVEVLIVGSWLLPIKYQKGNGAN